METSNLESENVNPMDMDIIDRGVMFTKKPMDRVKNARITKQELHDFVRWSFKHVNDEGWSEMSSLKIANLYFQETGKYISRSTVNRNRYNWVMKNGDIVRVN
jgi:hypothetical protein